jgi:hypothetical protein
MQTLISKKFNYTLNNYLLDLDLINKYSINNIKKVPKLNKLTIELSLNEILNFLENNNTSESDSEIQIKSFFILYIIDCYFPSINFTNTKLSNKNFSQKCCLKRTFLNKQSINETVVNLFNEFNLKFQFNKKNSKPFHFIKNNKEKLNFRTNFEFDKFIELDKFINNINPIKKFIIFIHFEFAVKDVFKQFEFKQDFFFNHLIQNLLFKFH